MGLAPPSLIRVVWLVVCGILLSSSTSSATIVPADPSKNITWPYLTFKTVDFEPPWLNITNHVAPSEGYLFFAPDGPTAHQIAPVIMDSTGELVWNGPVGHAFNFGVYEYKQRNVLGWWNGTVFPEPVGRGNGAIYLHDQTYEQIAEVTLPGTFLELVPGETFPSNIDLHELTITGRESIIVTANNVTQADLSSVGGPSNGWVVDSLVYEIDIKTNNVLFSWSSLDHLDQLPFTDSLYPLGSEGFTGQNQSLAWGYFHINSADLYEGSSSNGYLISSRYLCSAIHISASGKVVWRLSGRTGGDFKLVGSPEHTGFCYQHDIRGVNWTETSITLNLHDNHNCPIDNGTVPSTAKVLEVDFTSKEVTLQQRFNNASGPIYSTAQGNYQPLANGNAFVGHGWIPIMQEYSSTSRILSTIQFGAAEPRPGGGYLSATAPTLGYRSFKQSWVGCPDSRPDVVAESSSSGTTVWVSWNGATDVAAWEIYGGKNAKQLKLLTTVTRSGFETRAKVKKQVQFVLAKPKLKKGGACKDAIASSTVKVT